MWHIGLAPFQILTTPQDFAIVSDPLKETSLCPESPSFLPYQNSNRCDWASSSNYFRPQFLPIYQRQIGRYAVTVYPSGQDAVFRSLLRYLDPLAPEALPIEIFDFHQGVIERMPPRAPSQDYFEGNLPEEEFGWFESRLSMPGMNRRFLTYRPSVISSASLPVIIILHGTEGDSEGASRAANLDREAVKNIFGDESLVFILNARDLPAEDWEHYNTNYTNFWNTTDDHGNSNRDIQLVHAIILRAIRQYQGDSQRVFLFGHSNGGFFALQAGIALRHLVRGIAISSAGWVPFPPKPHDRMIFSSTRCEVILREGDPFLNVPQPNDWRFDDLPWIWRDEVSEMFNAPRPVSAFPSREEMPAVVARGILRDQTVFPYYTCKLGEQLDQLGSEHWISIIDRRDPQDGYHFWDVSFFREAWEHLAGLTVRR